MFLFVLLAEFGTHVLAHANAPHNREQLISTLDTGHDEPCKHIIPCCDNDHSNQQLPSAGHQLMHSNLLEVAQFELKIEFNIDPPIPFRKADALFRESTPPFHPPQLS